MRIRLTLLLAAAFFVTMNVLLWRTEYGARGHSGASVPAELIWDKLLTAPDFSALEIRHRGAKLGRGTWAATVAEGKATGLIMDEMPPEGMVEELTGYTLDFDGHILIEGMGRVKFVCHLDLDAKQQWEKFNLKLTLKPFSFEVVVDAAAQTAIVRTEDGDKPTERTFKLDELRDPSKLAREFGGPALPATLAALGLPLQSLSGTGAAANFKWEASNDRMRIGSNLVRVYRLEARLFERFGAVMFVSPVGELLRVELPDDITLINDALLTL